MQTTPEDPSPEDPLTYVPTKVSWVIADFVSRPPAWMPRAFLYALTATLGGALLYASVVEIAIHVDARGALLSDPPIMPVAVPVSLRVASLLVRENQTVEKGDVLLLSEDNLPKADLERIRATANAIRAVLSMHRDGHCRDCRTHLTEIAKDAFVITGPPALALVLSPARQALNQLQAAFARYGGSDGSAGKENLLVDNAHGPRRHGPEDGFVGQAYPLALAVMEARDELDLKLTTMVSALEVYRAERDVLAPISGVVQQLTLSGAGQFVSAGSEIMQLVPKNTTFSASLAVANKDISAIRIGLPVIVRLDAFPERRYGTVGGTVQSLPLSIWGGSGGSEAVYAVTVRLDRQFLVLGNDEYPFRIGMQLDGWIVTRHESMLVNAAHKLLGLSDSLGPR
jgi:multidrug efflux pump subunit AcrA (membrane-fusion protein)